MSAQPQGRFQGVLIASDFDGTVYGSVTGMSPRNVQAVTYFIQEGGIFTIATGRTYRTFSTHHHLIPSNSPAILSNGAGVYDFQENKQVRLTNLPKTAQEDLLELCRQMPELAFEAYHDTDIYAHNPNEITHKHMEIVGGQFTQLPIMEMPTPWLKVLLQQERPLLLEAREKIHQIRPHTYETTFSNPKYMEITALGINKASAVKSLAQEQGIDPAHIYCIGDNENDLCMLELSQIPFAPSSSAQVVLDQNPHVLCSCEEGAVADMIEVLKGKYPETK